MKTIFHEQIDHFRISSENPLETSKKQRIGNSYKLPKLSKQREHNVGIVNVMNKVSEEKDNTNSKMKNLAVQRIPQVDLKPDLVFQKLATIQIKPDSKKTLW